MAEGRKQSAILKSEAEKAQLINEAEGQVYIINHAIHANFEVHCQYVWTGFPWLTMTFQARAVIVAGEARAKSLQAVAEALGGAQV